MAAFFVLLNCEAHVHDVGFVPAGPAAFTGGFAGTGEKGTSTPTHAARTTGGWSFGRQFRGAWNARQPIPFGYGL